MNLFRSSFIKRIYDIRTSLQPGILTTIQDMIKWNRIIFHPSKIALGYSYIQVKIATCSGRDSVGTFAWDISRVPIWLFILFKNDTLWENMLLKNLSAFKPWAEKIKIRFECEGNMFAWDFKSISIVVEKFTSTIPMRRNTWTIYHRLFKNSLLFDGYKFRQRLEIVRQQYERYWTYLQTWVRNIYELSNISW